MISRSIASRSWPYSPLLRLRSAYHRCWYEISQSIKWPGRHYQESPSHALPAHVTACQRNRLEQLQQLYGTRFEDQFQANTALDNYVYLDLLHQSKEIFGWSPAPHQELVDVGSLNFYYAPALNACFQPRQLQGIELDGYRVYTNLYSRFDYAQCYIRSLPNTSFTVMDFCDFTGSADGMTCFYPFVKPEPLVAWRLPLKVFRPARLFAHIAQSLRTHGFFFMINHGADEARVACALAEQNGLALHGYPQPLSPLVSRSEIPIASLWTKPAV